MFVENDIFLIEGKEYKIDRFGKEDDCWMEPIVYRDCTGGFIISGGVVRIVQYDDLFNYPYIEWRQVRETL